MDPHLGIAIRTAESYPGGVDQVKEDIGYSRYWGGKLRPSVTWIQADITSSRCCLPELHFDLGVMCRQW